MAAELRCDARAACDDPVAYIDDKGFVYCTTHGVARQAGGRRCRKLRPHELRRLQAGDPLTQY